MKVSLTLFFLFLLNSTFASGLTIISGSDPDYAGSEILFYQYADPISEEKSKLFRLKFDENGNYYSTIQIEEVIHAFADLDSYAANIYLVPGKTYELILPPRKKVTSSQRHNPFFKPEHIHLATKNSDKSELNRKIRAFEKAFQKTESRFFEQIYRKKSTAAVDSVQTILREKFTKGPDSFFEDYKFYRLAFAEYALHQGKNENFIQKYFNNHQVNFMLAPCKNLFNRIYTNFFSQLTSSVDGDQFRKLLASSDLLQIESYLKKNHYLNSEIARLVVLKSVYDAFHQGQFSQKSLLSILTKIQAGSWSASHQAIAQRLEKKLTHLLPGTKAPALSMTDLKGKKITLNYDKLTYLHFTRISNPICRQHLDALKKLPDVVKNDVNILNLILEEEKQQTEQVSNQNWIGQFFVITDEVAELWKVKNFPTSFLIDESGKLVYSPANNPLEGFDRQIGSFLHRRHIENLRNQAR